MRKLLSTGQTASQVRDESVREGAGHPRYSGVGRGGEHRAGAEEPREALRHRARPEQSEGTR